MSHVKDQGAETWAQTKEIEIENGEIKRQGYPDQPDSVKPNNKNASAAVSTRELHNSTMSSHSDAEY